MRIKIDKTTEIKRVARKFNRIIATKVMENRKRKIIDKVKKDEIKRDE